MLTATSCSFVWLRAKVYKIVLHSQMNNLGDLVKCMLRLKPTSLLRHTYNVINYSVDYVSDAKAAISQRLQDGEECS